MGWQPIATVPHDADVLLGDSSSGIVESGYVDHEGYITAGGEWTHWQPLPAPPVS